MRPEAEASGYEIVLGRWRSRSLRDDKPERQGQGKSRSRSLRDDKPERQGQMQMRVLRFAQEWKSKKGKGKCKCGFFPFGRLRAEASGYLFVRRLMCMRAAYGTGEAVPLTDQGLPSAVRQKFGEGWVGLTALGSWLPNLPGPSAQALMLRAFGPETSARNFGLRTLVRVRGEGDGEVDEVGLGIGGGLEGGRVFGQMLKRRVGLDEA
jgi:hypothetical protein